MNELVKRSATSSELVKVNEAPPAKLFKHSNYEPLVIAQSSPRELTPVIDRNAWVVESMGAGPLAGIIVSFMGAFCLALPIASPFLGGIAFNPATLTLMIPGAAIMPMGAYSARRHVGRLRWVKQTSARRIRAWLSTTYGLHVPELEPKLAERFLNRNEVGATMALIDELGKTFTLYRVAPDKYVLRDAAREVVAQLPVAESAKATAVALNSATKRLPRSARALFEWASTLHTLLDARSGLSPEHEHRISRAGAVLTEIDQMTADLTKRPTAEYVKNVEASLGAITRDMEAIKDDLDSALERQAEVLATFTREVTGK